MPVSITNRDALTNFSLPFFQVLILKYQIPSLYLISILDIPHYKVINSYHFEMPKIYILYQMQSILPSVDGGVSQRSTTKLT